MNLSLLLYRIFRDKNISCIKKRKFNHFGKNSNIKKPYYQLSGVNRIKIGDNVTIMKNCRLAVYGEGLNECISIGNDCYIGFGFSVLADAKGKVDIGNQVLIASNVLITNEGHGINPELEIPYMEQNLLCKDVKIDEGCWIGEKVCILPGVHIGKKSIIGAGAIVTKSIPDYSIAVGNPARVIKCYNFDKKKWESLE